MKGRFYKSLFVGGLFLVCIPLLVNAAPIQSRQLQMIQVGRLYQLGVDTDPQWRWEVSNGDSSPVFSIFSPNNYYPSAMINFSYYSQRKLADSDFDIREAARLAIVTASENFGIVPNFSNEQLEPFEFKNFRGYSGVLTAEIHGSLRDIQVYVGRSPAGHPVSMTVVTTPSKLPHLSHLVSRFGNSFSPLK